MRGVARVFFHTVIFAFCAQSAAAQKKTSVALTLGPGFVRFADFGSGVATVVAQGSVAQDLTPHTGAELTTFAAIPLQVSAAQPVCVPGATCQSRATPSALMGGLLAGFFQMGESPMRLSAGFGRVTATGAEGPGARSSNVFQFGLEWSQERESGVRMTAGTRALQFATPISGARQLLLSGVGLRF